MNRKEDFTNSKWSGIAFGYIRVSTQEQTSNMSLTVQEDKIRKKAEELGMQLISVYADKGISGTSMKNRVELEEVIRVMRKGETLLCYALSRLSRSIKDLSMIVETLSDRGCRLILITDNLDTSDSYVQTRMLITSFASELEAQMIKDRVKGAMDYLKQEGRHVGRIPYGWRLVDGKGSGLEEVPEEQAIIKRIRECIDGDGEDGKKYSYSALARKFNEEGVPPPQKSKEWNHNNISRLYQRKEIATKGRHTK